MKQELTIAVSKGRILKETLPLLQHAGIELIDDPKVSRKLILDTNHDDVKVVILRATDVPTFVEYGVADIGIAGKDVLMEFGGGSIYEPVDLKISKCRLMTAGKPGANERPGRLKIATKFVNVAKKYFAEQGKQVEVIKLYGSMELAPIVDLADMIVDIVDTGNTLKANGLVPLDHIADISSRLIINKASMKMKHERIQSIIDSIQQAVG